MIKYVQTLVDDIAILPNENYAHFYANFFNKQTMFHLNQLWILSYSAFLT